MLFADFVCWQSGIGNAVDGLELINFKTSIYKHTVINFDEKYLTNRSNRFYMYMYVKDFSDKSSYFEWDLWFDRALILVYAALKGITNHF